MKRVLVTGSEGFIGRAMCQKLVSSGYDVIAFDKNLGHDVTREDDVSKAAAHSEAAIHLGGPCSVRMFQELPERSWLEAVEGMKNILHYSSGRILFASSCTVYGESIRPAPEDKELPLPPNLYAAAKVECEGLCLQAASHGADVRILRIFTGYGPGELQKGSYASPLMHFARHMVIGRKPILYGDGTQIRDFVFIDDIVEFLFRALETTSHERVFNVGTGRGTSFRQAVRMITACIGNSCEPEYTPAPESYVSTIVADTQRTTSELDYTARVGVEEGIRRTVLHVETNGSFQRAAL